MADQPQQPMPLAIPGMDEDVVAVITIADGGAGALLARYGERRESVPPLRRHVARTLRALAASLEQQAEELDAAAAEQA